MRPLRHHRPRQAGPDPAHPQRRVGDASTVSLVPSHPISLSPAYPETPPPSYHEIDLANPFQTTTPMYSSTRPRLADLPPPPSHRLKKKVSAWVTRVDLAQQRNNDSSGGEEQWESTADLLSPPRPGQFDDRPLVQSMNQGAALCDRVAARLTDVFSRVGVPEGDDEETGDLPERLRDLSLEENNRATEESHGGIINFKKTWLYANSRLPPHMLPIRFYLDTWRLICVAAQASLDAYRRPRADERADHIEADWRSGTKAMVIKSRPIDDKNLIVLAIRGSRKNFVDWSVNFGTAPTEPRGFLDDPGNACHTGFLQVARKSLAPVTARLRALLRARKTAGGGDPDSRPALLITGHSAGGAVASLLYMHLLSTEVASELNGLLPYFKRVCCVTFGVPPLSLLPLQKPAGRQFAKNEFFSFVNEGDLIARADRQYLRTIAGIIAAPAPVKVSNGTPALRVRPSRQVMRTNRPSEPVRPPYWIVTPATLSNAGRLVLLRKKPGQASAVEAVQVTDQELRDVVFGDPDMHSMELYKERTLTLATAAITGSING